MNYKIVEKSEFLVIGKKTTLSTVNQEHLKKIPLLWQKIYQEGTLARLLQLAAKDRNSANPLGICSMADGKQDEFSYMIGVIAPGGAQNSEFEPLAVPAATWAVFEVKGKVPEAIQEGFRQIYDGPFPISDYEKAAGPDIEVYHDGDMSSPDYYCEIWIPVAKK